MDTIVITGGAGFIGAELASACSHRFEVRTLDLRPSDRAAARHFVADLLDYESLLPAFEGARTVVHLAGIPHPQAFHHQRTLEINTIGTYNVLEAMLANRVRELVFMTSEAALGLTYFARKPVTDLTFPIETATTLRANESYGLSKLLCEKLIEQYCQEYDLGCVSLRCPWVWNFDNLVAPAGRTPEGRGLTYGEAVNNPEAGKNHVWAYLALPDLLEALQRAITATSPGRHIVVPLTAPDTFSRIKSLDLLARFYPDCAVKSSRFQRDEFATFYDLSDAERFLGFRPAKSWRERADVLLGSDGDY
jgi:nucleoside-diphosphate-sugar epimerase